MDLEARLSEAEKEASTGDNWIHIMGIDYFSWELIITFLHKKLEWCSFQFS